MSRPIVVASNVLLSPYNKILLGRRADCGRWEVSGGKVESDENIVNAGRREHYEETGMILLDEFPVYLGYSLRPGDKRVDNQLFLCMFYLWREWEGSPNVVENCHTEWKWFGIDKLPSSSDCTYGTAQFIEEMLPAFLTKRVAREQLRKHVAKYFEDSGLAHQNCNGVEWEMDNGETYVRGKRLDDLTESDVWHTITFIEGEHKYAKLDAIKNTN